jgi:hypothetical protein
MDPKFAKYLAKTTIYPQNVRLTEFQGRASFPTPGIYGAARGAPTFFVPQSIPQYQVSKQLNDIPQTSTNDQDAVIVPNTSSNSLSQLSEQIPVNQTGFGDVRVNNSNNSEIDLDIDLNSLKKVSDSVLQAFENPVIHVETEVFNPKKKKLNLQTGKGQATVRKKYESKKLPKSQMKFI